MFYGAVVGIVLTTLPMVVSQLSGPATPLAATEATAALPASMTIQPEDDLVQALESLEPGGVTELRLAPGTYDVFDRDVALHAGTPEDRITVVADDPEHPPVIRGSLVLQDPQYLTIDRLVFKGARSSYEALRMEGGSNWMILRSEFMGQPGYTAQALLNITSYQATAPQSFRVAYSCFHDGPTAPPSVHDHLVYVTSKVPPSPSYVSRNILWGSPNGSAIKSNSSNVRINYNTIQDVAGAVTVQENPAAAEGIAGVMTERNLIQTVRTLPGTDYTQVFWASLLNSHPAERAKWLLRDNYAYSSNRPAYLKRSASSRKTVRIVGGGLETTSGNPSFNKRQDCNGYRPALPAAKEYGRWAGDGRSMLPPR
jgi:hypothetical protein